MTSPRVEALQEELHSLYRGLHAAPELSMREERTAALIQARMDGLGFETFRSGGTGFVAVLRMTGCGIARRGRR